MVFYKNKIFQLFLVSFIFTNVQGQSGPWFLRVAVDPEIEFCGPHKFYCEHTGKCISRDQRCLNEQNVCSDQNNCYSIDSSPDAEDSRFFVFRAFSSILESGSFGGAVGARNQPRRSRRNVKHALRTLMFDPWKHSFVQYRGFAYEFGKYGVQELDINDPNYKYDREWTSHWEIVTNSTCSRSDLWSFIRKWNLSRGNYLWYANNCHHFTNAFLKFLKMDCAVDFDILED